MTQVSNLPEELAKKLNYVVNMARQYEAALQRVPEAANDAEKRLEQAKREFAAALSTIPAQDALVGDDDDPCPPHCCCCGPYESCCDCGQIMPSKTCVGEKCWCGAPASKKVGEEIAFDDPNPARHNLTSYVCARHYAQLMGPLGAEQVGLAKLPAPPVVVEAR